MPDWTYHPLEPVVARVLGGHRTHRWALAMLAMLIRYAGGRRWIPVVFDHPQLPSSWRGRFGASVPPQVARDAVCVLPVQGASIVEIGPVTGDDVDTVRTAAAGRRCRVVAVADTADVADAVRPYVDDAFVGDAPNTVRLTVPRISTALQALSDPSETVLARPEVLIAAGPGWFGRVIEAAVPTTPPPSWRHFGPRPLRWPGWTWATLVGVGLIVAGVGAAVIALGPVLLTYDRTFLGASTTDLRGVNPHLIGFLQHDRITMAGNMIGIGILYLGLAQAMRQGFQWARRVLALSGVVVFGSYFYFLLTGGFVEPLHTLVVVVLTPMWVIALRRGASDAAHWPTVAEGPEPQRRRALWGQLMMIGVGGGLAVAGVVISAVGMTTVFVPTDLDFMGTHAQHLEMADPHLLPFIAHDRAGFGGALIGAGLAIALIAMWGWRRRQRWVWWSLALGCAFGTVPVLIVHFSIGYTHFEHLLPVYVLLAVTVVALVLAKPYLDADDDVAAEPVRRSG